MKQARGGLGGWRWAFLLMGLVPLLIAALPAQAGPGDLLEPVEDTPVVGIEPIAGYVVDPLVDDIVEPVGGDLVDPNVDEELAPIAPTVVTPIADDAMTPVLDAVQAPVTETNSPVGPTPTLVIASNQEDLVGSSGGETTEVGSTQLKSLEAALALQTTLVGGQGTAPSGPDGDQPVPENRVEADWLNWLTNWLRSSAAGLLNVLALPISLLELLARALLTAGSGLIAPLSMLAAFTALLIKDRRWDAATPSDNRWSSGSY